MSVDVIFLFGAGLLGGILNSVAGGGSFITFPALLFVGVNPVAANATNTFSSCAGYLSGAYAFRNELSKHRKELPRLIATSIIGGIIGAWLLLQTPEALFQKAIPWLLLFATILFAFGGKVSSLFKCFASRHQNASLAGRSLLILALLSICIYGGFFNAGLGIIVLSYLALAGHANINAMNGMKLLISSVVSLIAIVIFIHENAIAWREGIAVLGGALVGGYVAAHVSRRLPQHYVRSFIILASCGITAYFFIENYAI